MWLRKHGMFISEYWGTVVIWRLINNCRCFVSIVTLTSRGENPLSGTLYNNSLGNEEGWWIIGIVLTASIGSRSCLGSLCATFLQIQHWGEQRRQWAVITLATPDRLTRAWNGALIFAEVRQWAVKRRELCSSRLHCVSGRVSSSGRLVLESTPADNPLRRGWGKQVRGSLQMISLLNAHLNNYTVITVPLTTAGPREHRNECALAS